jgi:hypothetical protein
MLLPGFRRRFHQLGDVVFDGQLPDGSRIEVRRGLRWVVQTRSIFSEPLVPDPFTIRIYVPDGDPEGLRIIDRMNWTGQGIVVPREDWAKVKCRSEFAKPGVYILVGYVTDDDLPTIYIGQGDVVRNRIDNHVQNKDFWTKAVVFVSSVISGGLNRAHATWLEHALIDRAVKTKRSHLENGTEPQEPSLSEAEKADTQAFLREMLGILPLVGLNAFEAPKAVAQPMAHEPKSTAKVNTANGIDTIVVPAQKDGFERVFVGENAWKKPSILKVRKILYVINAGSVQNLSHI